MRVIDRIFEYLKYQNLTPYKFERACGIANGYLKKQTKGKGTIGSEILEKIAKQYKDLCLKWLITGTGKMLLNDSYSPSGALISEEHVEYLPNIQIVQLLQGKIAILENALSDKEKIIRMLEEQIKKQS